ncbi:MAG: EAL domain-containing response regulator [Terracidiphilus sp.]|jgi:EAL domain-containing protein (putative c-di-GMP-specific phosphodiesterase class I)/CheY-like chemotaxis protein
MTAKRKILVIDDEVDVGEFVAAAAQAMGLDCTATTNAKSFLESLKADVDLVLLDLMMPEVDGIELLRMLKKRKCKAGLILMSGSGMRIMESAEQLAHALGLTIAGRLQKPFRLAELEQVLERKAESKAQPATRQDRRPALHREELRRAIKLEEFVLHYQPQIDIATGSVIGVEALVRWQHLERGLIYPDSFIGIMEKHALIDELGWIVANRGMSEVGQFADSDGKALMLSLNESVHSLHDLKFPDVLVSLAEKHGVSPADITVEITESGLINEPSNTLDILTRLRMKQVKLSVDDFGTGYAMMQQLKNIPATELKIDRSFVMELQNNERDRIMIQKTIEMGHELGMHVVAEGVETQEQLDFLRLSGCDSAQGYLFSRPIPANAMVSWLEAYRSKLLDAA